MIRFKNTIGIKDYILDTIDQIDIFVYYGSVYGNGLSKEDVVTSINRNSYKVKNPLRVERKPSFSFRKELQDGIVKVVAHDFGNNFYSGDCFNFAGIALHLNCNDGKDFIKICKHILDNVTKDKHIVSNRNTEVIPKQLDNFEIIPFDRDFTSRDYKFWESIGIIKHNIDRHVMPIQSFELYRDEERIGQYFDSYKDPCYGYYLGLMKERHRYKLYLPYRTNRRFITNNIFAIDDIRRIKPNRICILIKSIKDRILLSQILNEMYITDIQVIAISSEAAVLSAKELQILKRFYEDVYVLFDNDKAGINAMSRMNKDYGFMPLYLIHSIKTLYEYIIPIDIRKDDVIIHDDIPKDLSDFSKGYGYSMTKELTTHLIEGI